MRIACPIALCLLLLAACTPPPPVNQSRAILWQRFAYHSIDEILLAWGAPSAETKLTDGSRLIVYRRGMTYDAASPYEQTVGCEVSFLAPKDQEFTIENIAMTGDAGECAELAAHGPGYTRIVAPPPPPPAFYPGFYYR